MVKKLLLGFFVLLQITVSAQKTYWQQEVNYTINVTLNDKDNTLDAFEKIVYVNNSPDTLRFIWFHLWPNAYKNDKTAFCEQMVGNGNTDFYFSKEEDRGYINRLDFRVDGVAASYEEHPVNIDIAKLNLPTPLAPGKSVTITTPFHEKLPKNVSRGGFTGKTFQVTQWYPKPAVYDNKGWHRMPYLDQGEFFSEFGRFDVTITLPANYIVAATGNLQNEDELQKLKTLGRQNIDKQENYQLYKKSLEAEAKKTGKDKYEVMPASAAQTKTLRYTQEKVHDFAWFASKLFVVQYDTVQLTSKTVDAFTFFHPWEKDNWEKSIAYTKDGTRKYSQYLAEYPYSVVNVVSGNANDNSGGMEYPTVTLITLNEGGQELDITIAHEIGHNWFYSVLASNERDHPWMDEGMNTYYQNRYELEKYGNYSLVTKSTGKMLVNKLPDDALELMLNFLFKLYKDQPIETPSEKFTFTNYGLIAYVKAGLWMKKLEEQLGKATFDSAMRSYYRDWAYKHPYPEDFKLSIEKSSGKNIDDLYNQLSATGPLTTPQKKSLKLTGFFNLRETDKYNYISLSPQLGYNMYDKLMIGVLIHNYQIPAPNFRFAVAPLYATNSKQFNGIGQASYHWYSKGKVGELAVGVNGAKFSTNDGVDSNGSKVFTGFEKLVPWIQVVLNNKDPRSKTRRWFDLRNYIIREGSFNYVTASDNNSYPEKGKSYSRYINQFSFITENNRALYPYRYEIQVQQGKEFYRTSATLNYFFNYANSGGLKLRLTAIKFGYIGGKTPLKQINTSIYQPKLTAVRGNEDYTYSNYFVGRNEFEGFASQQIMERDGNLKIRTDIFADLQGRSDDWVAAINLSTTVPKKILPLPFPIKIFADAGTNADAWKKDASVSRFLYVAGLQLSILDDFIDIYAPILYSKEFGNSLKTVPEENKFFKKISFSINIQKLSFRKLLPELPL